MPDGGLPPGRGFVSAGTPWSSRPLVACHPSLPSPCVRNRLLMVGKPVAPTGDNNERTEPWMKGSTIDCGFNLLGYARIY
jgi:hypothetical protein